MTTTGSSKPLKALNSNERRDLQILRYKSYLRSVAQIHVEIRGVNDQLRQLSDEAVRLKDRSDHLLADAVLFTAEARDQVTILANDYGMTIEEIAALADVPPFCHQQLALPIAPPAKV